MVLLALTLLLASQAAALELLEQGSSTWPRHLLQSKQAGPKPPGLAVPERDPAVRHIAAAISQYAAYQYYPPGMLPPPKVPSTVLAPRVAFLARFILGRSPAEALENAEAAAYENSELRQTLRQQPINPDLPRDPESGSPQEQPYPDALDLKVLAQITAEADSALELQQRLGSKLSKDGSVHQVLLEGDQQPPGGRVRWVVLYNTGKTRDGQPLVEYWGAWKTPARAQQMRDIATDGRW